MVSIACGLDLSRDVATHFLQQRLLVSQVELARRIHLPLVIREKAAGEKLIEVIAQTSGSASASDGAADGHSDWQLRVAIHSFSGSDAQLAAYVDAGFYVMINGQICDLRVDSGGGKADGQDGSSQPAQPALLPELAGEGAALFRQLRAGLLPIERLLLCSDAPLHTPQNIDDVHVRSQRNEPANLPFVYDIVARAYRMTLPQLRQHIEHNARTFYQLRYKQPETAAAAADDSKQAAVPAAASETKQQPSMLHSEQGRRAVDGADKTSGQSLVSGSAKKQLATVVQQMKQLSTAEPPTARRVSQQQQRQQQVQPQPQQPTDEDSVHDSSEEASEEEEEEEEDGRENSETQRSDSTDEPTKPGQQQQQREEEDDDSGEVGSEDEDKAEEAVEESAAAGVAGRSIAAAGRRQRHRQRGDASGSYSEEDDWNVASKSRRKVAAAAKGRAQSSRQHDKQPQTVLQEISNHGQADEEAKESAAAQQSDEETSERDRRQSQPTTERRNKSAASSSRHRVVGGEVDLSLERDILRYACRRCRTVLFSEDDVIPHAAPRSDSASSVAGGGGGGGGRKKGSIASVDLTHCESSFIRPMTWMRNLAMSGGSSSSIGKLSAVLVNSDRIECPCGAKLGRCGMVALYIPCLCGRLCDGPPPYFAIHHSRVDVIDRSALQALAAPRAVGEQWTETQREAEEEERTRQLSRKERERLRKDNKKVKRQTREDQVNAPQHRTPLVDPLLASSRCPSTNATDWLICVPCPARQLQRVSKQVVTRQHPTAAQSEGQHNTPQPLQLSSARRR